MSGCHRPVELTQKGIALLTAPIDVIDKASKLTVRQAEELGRLAATPQNTYGKARTRLQNALVGYGLASFDTPNDTCCISDLGRQVWVLLK